MKRLPRNPLKYEPLELLGKLAAEKKVRLNDPKALASLVEDVRVSTEQALTNPIHVHGKRAEARFEMVVASLGEIDLLKQEDAGDGFHSLDDEVKVPDFRIVLKGGRQLLVEVKNHHQDTGNEPFSQRRSNVEALERYAQLVNCQLFFAIYWSGWNIWTLVRSSDLKRNDTRCTTTLCDAVTSNQMALVGDKLVATRVPISLRMEFDLVEKTDTDDGSLMRLRIRSAKIYSEDREVTDRKAVALATFIMFNSDWAETEIPDWDSEGNLRGTTFSFAPATEEQNTDATQGFSFVGTLSAMLSRMYASRTVKSGEVVSIRANFKPGQAVGLLPEPKSEHALPLWIIQQDVAAAAPVAGANA